MAVSPSIFLNNMELTTGDSIRVKVEIESYDDSAVLEQRARTTYLGTVVAYPAIFKMFRISN